MSNAITDARNALKTALTSDTLNVHVTTPERVATPLAFIGPSDPYLTTEGATFGGEVLNLEVVVVADPGVNEERAKQLDGLVLQVFDAAFDAGFRVSEVQRPGGITLGGQKYVAAVINVRTELHRG